MAYAGTVLVGFGLVRGDGPDPELSALFIDPPWIGRGVGGELLSDVLEIAHRHGATRLLLDADPGAVPFYTRHGARRIGDVPSGSIAGRTLPRMEFFLLDRSR